MDKKHWINLGVCVVLGLTAGLITIDGGSVKTRKTGSGATISSVLEAQELLRAFNHKINPSSIKSVGESSSYKSAKITAYVATLMGTETYTAYISENACYYEVDGYALTTNGLLVMGVKYRAEIYTDENYGLVKVLSFSGEKGNKDDTVESNTIGKIEFGEWYSMEYLLQNGYDFVDSQIASNYASMIDLMSSAKLVEQKTGLLIEENVYRNQDGADLFVDLSSSKSPNYFLSESSSSSDPFSNMFDINFENINATKVKQLKKPKVKKFDVDETQKGEK